MRHADRWVETKYVLCGRILKASRDPSEVGVGSRLITDRVAALYGQYLPRFAHGRLGDLGCGKAPLYGVYRTYVSESICVDWPQSVHGNPYLDYEVDLSGRLPFSDAFFDTLLLSDVLEHVPEPDVLWHEMARVLAPGGYLLLNVPFLYGVHEAPNDYARYTEFALRRFACHAGLVITQLQPVGGSLHVLADLLAKHLTHVPLGGKLMARAVQGTVALLDRGHWGQCFAAKTAVHFPLGYFMVARKPAVAEAAAVLRTDIPGTGAGIDASAVMSDGRAD